MTLLIAILCICLLRIYIDVRRKPTLLPIVTRVCWGLVFALLMAAALNAEEIMPQVIIRCTPCGFGWFCCVG